MPSTLIQDLDLVEPLEIQHAFVFLSDEVTDLQVVDNFLLALERRYLQETAPRFDPVRVRSTLRVLEGFSGELHVEKFNDLLSEVKSGIDKWKSSLETRDSAIHAYHIRQFCDEPGRMVQPMVYSALTRFYRGLSSSAESQSKFDLAITRLFAKSPNPPYREMLIDRDDLSEQIGALFEGWDLEGTARRSSPHSSLLIAKLDDFQREALSLANYEELLRSDLFDRLRAFKRKLGPLYRQPDIAAAAIECNIAVGNSFNRLLNKANNPVHEKLNEGIDLAEAFYDASPRAEEYISDILFDVRKGSSEGDEKQGQKSASVEDILSLVCEGPDTWRDSDQSRRGRSGSAKSSSSADPPIVQKRLEPVFRALSKPEPDLSVMRGHMARFGGLKDIDIADFIRNPEDPNEHLCRNVLGVMFWIEELCDNELNKSGKMTSALRDDLHRLLRKSEEFSEQLDYLVRENADESLNRLLIVSNRLLDARLKLKRGIARFTRRNIGQVVRDPAAAEADLPEIVPPKFAVAAAGPTNRWIIATMLVITLLSVGLYFFDKQVHQIIPVASDVEFMDVNRLPGGEHFSQALQKNGVMVLTAKQSWSRLPVEEQRAKLEALKKLPTSVSTKEVMVTDESGRMLGDSSAKGTRVIGELKFADSGKDKGGQDEALPKIEDQQSGKVEQE